MAKINLLPWREERRKELQQQFIMTVVLFAVFGAFCAYGVYGYFSSEVSSQIQKNKFIEGEIAGLETKITEIRALQERRDQIVDSMKVIQELQGNRPVIVHELSEIATTIPDGVYYTKIEKKGNHFTFYGVAESSSKISKLMRNLEDSEWFKDVKLPKIEAIKDKNGEEKSSKFEITLIEEALNDDESEASGKKVNKGVKGK